MNLQTVITNLKNTIAGKEHLLDQYARALDGDKMLYEQKIAVGAAKEFLEINIAELKRILDDLVECSVQGINLSWQQNPDRSGGQFTDEEINRANEWR